MTEYSVNMPEEAFDTVKADYQAHDKTCSSIPNLWIGRKGGFSDMWSQGPCDGCDVWFYIEGLKWYEGSGTDGVDEQSFCDCCDRKRQK